MLLMMLIILMMIIIIIIIIIIMMKIMIIIAIVVIFHEGTKLAKAVFSSLGFFILNQFSCLVEFHFHFIWIILSFRKYADFKSKKKRFFVTFEIIP